jgi:hypothetical protein
VALARTTLRGLEPTEKRTRAISGSCGLSLRQSRTSTLANMRSTEAHMMRNAEALAILEVRDQRRHVCLELALGDGQ